MFIPNFFRRQLGTFNSSSARQRWVLDPMRRLRYEPLEQRRLLSLSALIGNLDSVAEESASVSTETTSVFVEGPTRLAVSGLENLQAIIVAGDPKIKDPSDSPANRVDPNTTSSPYAGVGSLYVQTSSTGGYIGTATAIDPYYVLTAAHMIDLNNDGSIDVAPGDVRFILNYGSDLSHQIFAAELFIHPDWDGFNNPIGTVNDDIAVIKLSEALPAGVPIYPLYTGAFGLKEVTLVGYGQSGDGVKGYTVDAAFDVKRVGANMTDRFDEDDERFDDGSPEGSAGGPNEIFLYDFDGRNRNFSGDSGLGNDVETTLGGGDSGGPAFVNVDGQLEIFGVNTFTFSFTRKYRAPKFGSGGGGMVVSAYASWIDSVVVDTTPPAEVNDVAITAITAADSVAVGDTVSVGVTVRNVGNQNVSDNIEVTLVSDNGTPSDDSDDITIGSEMIIGGLNAGTSALLTFSWDTGDAKIGNHVLTATQSYGDDNTANDSMSTTVNVHAPIPASANDIYVSSIDFVQRNYGKGGSRHDLLTTVTVHRDADGDGIAEPGSGDVVVAGATVQMTLSRPGRSWSLQGTTDSSGQVTFTLKRAAEGTLYTAEVTDILHGTYSYEAGLNIETSDSHLVTPSSGRARSHPVGDTAGAARQFVTVELFRGDDPITVLAGFPDAQGALSVAATDYLVTNFPRFDHPLDAQIEQSPMSRQRTAGSSAPRWFESDAPEPEFHVLPVTSELAEAVDLLLGDLLEDALPLSGIEVTDAGLERLQ